MEAKENFESLDLNAAPKIMIDGVFFQIIKSGIARVWESLLNEWATQKFAKHLVVLDRAGTAPKIAGITYRKVPPYGFDRIAPDRQMLQTICNQEQANLFISTYYTTPLVTPTVMMVYDMIPEVMQWDLSIPMWQEKRNSILMASSYIAISESTARDLRRFYPGIPAANITIAYPGVSPTFMPASEQEIEQVRHRFNIQKPYFLMVGLRDKHKNGDLFFEGFSQLPNQSDFAVVCTGADPNLTIRQREIMGSNPIYMLNLSNADLRTIYSGAFALVYPSKYEGFGLPVLEAMACGCPVIACPVSSVPEVAGQAVLYTSETDAEVMKRALIEMQTLATRQSLIAAGLEQAQKFSWATMAERVRLALIRAA